MKSNSILVLAAAALLLGSVRLALADDKADEQVVALATARAKAEIAVNKAMATFDTNRNGWTVAAQATETAYTKITTTIQKAVQKENAKPEADRNAAFLDQCQTRMQAIQQDWSDYANRDRQVITVAYQEASTQLQSLNQVFAGFSQYELYWKNAKMDLAPMQANFDAIAKRAAELKDQGQKAIDELTAKQKVWEVNLDAATKEFGK